MHIAGKRSRQKGAALLGFMLITIVGLSYYLIRDLNQNIRRGKTGVESMQALAEAKQALLSWAINHPINPGTLPMPDRREATSPNYDGDSDCVNVTILNSHLLGKIPWRDYPAPCKDAGALSGIGTVTVDSSGEVLWYAVSKNLVYESPAYPLISVAILEKTTDWITVRDSSGTVISDRAAFVVIAPRSALTSQDRSGAAPVASNYLDSVTIGGTCSGGTVTGGTTYNNSDTTNLEFIIYPDSDLTGDACDSFNDLLVFVTIDELIDGVKKRALGEMSNILTAYHNAHGALPWLAPFSDPKADSRILHGTHTGSNNAAILTDSNTDFTKWGVKKFDIVRNVTDGSLSIVTNKTATTVTVTNIDLGNASNDNDFDTGDEYYIVAMDTAKKFDEKANASSSGLTLVDDNQKFVTIGVIPGDIIDNITDGSSGVVESVSSESTIIVKSLCCGTDDDFDNDDKYQIRSYTGESTNGSTGLTLEDATRNFITMGVSVGDVIINQEDGSIGRIASVDPTLPKITASSLNFGMQNDFDDNEIYILPQYYGIAGTREGLLSFHRVGGYFPSGFDIDWNIPELINGTANAAVSVNTPSTHPDYINNLKQFVQTSTGTSGTITVDIDKGTCVWTLPEIVECKGRYSHASMQGIVTNGYGGDGSGSIIFDDNTKNFQTAGIDTGAIVLNYDDEDSLGSGTAEANSSGTTLTDTGAFAAYGPADYYNLIVRNTTLPGKAQGILTKVIGANTIEVVDYDGSGIDPITFSENDDYSIYAARKLVVKNRIGTDTLRVNRLSSEAPDIDTNEFYGIKSPTAKITSAATSTGGLVLNDNTQTVGIDDFNTKGIKRGDVVHNLTDDSWGEITDVTPQTITATLYDNVGTPTDFDTGDAYDVYYSYVNIRRYEFIMRFSGTTVTGNIGGSRIRDVCLGYTNCTGSATNVDLPYYNLDSSGTAAAASTGLLLEGSAGENFDQRRITPGYTVFNTTDESNGIITTLNTNKQVTVGELNDGLENDFDSGDSYYISAPIVTIKDYDASNNPLGSASVTIPSGGAQGSIKVASIDYYLHSIDIDSNDDGDYNDVGDIKPDIPPWFVRNKWYQYLYIAYSNGDTPGVATACTAGTDCLVLNLGANPPENDIRALVMITGEAILKEDAVTPQLWASGQRDDYYDLSENRDADNTFARVTPSNIFNDMIRIATSCPPPDNAKLCWSN